MTDELARLKQQFEPKEASTLKVDRQLSAARFTPCGKLLLAAGHDARIRRFDATIDDYPELRPLAGHRGWVQRIAMPTAPSAGSPTEVVYSADSWGQLRCAKYREPEADALWAVPAAHDGWILDLAISADGSRLVTGGIDKKIRVWSTSDGTCLAEFPSDGSEVLSVVFSPDNSAVVAGDLAGTLTQWDLASKKKVRTIQVESLHKADRLQEVGGVRRLAFSPDETYLLACGTRPKNGGNVQGIPTIIGIDWNSGQPAKTIELGADGDVYVTDLAFHAEGFLILTVSGNPGTGKLIFRRWDDMSSFYETTKMPNCQSCSLHPTGDLLAVVATNAGSNGNGRNLDKEGKYPGNYSPIHLLRFPGKTAP